MPPAQGAVVGDVEVFLFSPGAGTICAYQVQVAGCGDGHGGPQTVGAVLLRQRPRLPGRSVVTADREFADASNVAKHGVGVSTLTHDLPDDSSWLVRQQREVAGREHVDGRCAARQICAGDHRPHVTVSTVSLTPPDMYAAAANALTSTRCAVSAACAAAAAFAAAAAAFCA